MNLWKVVEVIDGDTFVVYPEWVWENKKGNLIRPLGYDTPEINEYGYEEAKQKLKRLIMGKTVELGRGVGIDRGRLLCHVFYNGKDLAEYFPEYKV